MLNANPTSTTKLTANEITVLRAIIETGADSTGGDFTFADEVTNSLEGTMKQQAVAAVLGSLEEKRIIGLDQPLINGKKLSTSQIEAWEVNGETVDNLQELAVLLPVDEIETLHEVKVEETSPVDAIRSQLRDAIAKHETELAALKASLNALSHLG